MITRTSTISAFKAETNTDVIEVVRNPKTSKLFFTFNGGTGAVSKKGIPSKNPVVSLVSDDTTGETLWVLHEKGESANVVASF